MCELLHRSREIEAPHLGTIGTVARGINDLGEIVGYFANANGTQASSPAVPCSRRGETGDAKCPNELRKRVSKLEKKSKPLAKDD